QCAEHREDLLEIRLRSSYPAVPEILEDHAGYPEFAGPALHQEGLAGSDPAGNQVPHRKRMERSAFKKLSVLPQPGFDRIVTREIVQREGRFNELEQSLAFFFDHILFHASQERRRDGLVFLESDREDCARADPAQSRQATREVFDRYFAP